MNKFISLPCLAVLSLAAASFNGMAAPRDKKRAPHTISQRFDFAGKAQATFQSFGIDFFFSDVPADQLTNGRDLQQFAGKTLAERLLSETSGGDFGPNGENFYQLTQIYDRLDARFSGQAIAYSNRSDDADVNLQMVVGQTTRDKLKPNTTYLITAKLDFVSKASSSGFGVGGSPDSNSFGLVVSHNPWVAKVSNGNSAPERPSEPAPDTALNSYYGIAGSFFIDRSELLDLASIGFENLTPEDLSALGSDSASQLKALNSLYAKILAQLPKIDTSSDLSQAISRELDANIKAKLSELGAEELEQLKGMFGAPSEPVLLSAASSAASETSSAYIRTSTTDQDGRVIPLGIPSGSCTSGLPLNDLDADDRFICERYSYMGRINSGLTDQSGAWAQNSISTQKALEFTTDADANPIYLNLSSHSGFEGVTVYYVTGLEYRLVEKK